MFLEHFVFRFFLIFELHRKSFGWFSNNSNRVVKTAFYLSSGIFRRQCDLFEKTWSFFHFETAVERKIWTFVEKKSDSFVKMELYLSRGSFVDLFLHISCFSFTFRHWTKSFVLLTEIFLSGVVKLHSTCPGFFRISSPKHCTFSSIVSGFWLKTVRTFVKKFPVVCLKRHSLRPEQNFEENGFLKIFFSFCHFRTFIEKQVGWFAKSPRELSKLRFRCPEEYLMWMYFFWIIVFYSLPFGPWAKNFPDFC